MAVCSYSATNFCVSEPEITSMALPTIIWTVLPELLLSRFGTEIAHRSSFTRYRSNTTTMTDMIKLLAKLLDKGALIANLKEAIANYEVLPIDENYTKVAMCSTLVAMKDEADSEEINKLLEDMVNHTIPFFTASAN